MTSRFKKNRQKYIASLALVFIPVLVLFKSTFVFGAVLSSRSVTIDSSKASVFTGYTFNFKTITPGIIGSIILEFCSNTPLQGLPCTVPTGLDMSTAILTSQSGIVGFSIDPSSTANKVILTRAAAFSASANAQYVFSNAKNPSVIGSQFVRISTYSSIDGSGVNIDDGGVAYAITSGVGASVFVPPFLAECVAVSVAPDCSSSTGTVVSMGELSNSVPKTATTQFAVATNDVQGFVSYIIGTTMTSGNNVIPALVIPSASSPGTSQFGVNLRANTIPSTGNDPSGLGTGVPTANYNTPNLFMFSSGDAIASSIFSTDYSLFTVSYMANISGAQAPGLYTTTMTYVAVVQF